MTVADVPLGMRLKEEAGWNQTEADWRRFLDLEPEGCFVAELDGQPVGTTTTCVFGSVAWVAMVLVDATVRGRGVGKALMTHALRFLDDRGVRTVRLDATPMGQPLYEDLGFRKQYTLARYEGSSPTFRAGPPTSSAPREQGGERSVSQAVNTAGPGDVQAARPEYLETILRLDRGGTRTDRRKLLERLWQERPGDMRVICWGGAVGFLTSRPGSRAVQLGPCIATPDAARLLLADACQRMGGAPIYIDVPTRNQDAVDWVLEARFSPRRLLMRMCRGEPILEAVDLLWASSGPEMG
jgi:GNAT superfamily N-acetyltransferase